MPAAASRRIKDFDNYLGDWSAKKVQCNAWHTKRIRLSWRRPRSFNLQSFPGFLPSIHMSGLTSTKMAGSMTARLQSTDHTPVMITPAFLGRHTQHRSGHCGHTHSGQHLQHMVGAVRSVTATLDWNPWGGGGGRSGPRGVPERFALFRRWTGIQRIARPGGRSRERGTVLLFIIYLNSRPSVRSPHAMLELACREFLSCSYRLLQIPRILFFPERELRFYSNFFFSLSLVAGVCFFPSLPSDRCCLLSSLLLSSSSASASLLSLLCYSDLLT